MKVHRTIEFDRLEFEAFKRIEPIIRIAFPTDAIDEAKLAALGQNSKSADKRVEEAKRAYRGRALKTVCTQHRDRHAATRIWDAWDQLAELRVAVAREADPEHWRAQTNGEPVASIGGRDMAEVLAEARRQQLADVEEAIVVMTEAVTLVGARPDDDNPEV